MMQSFIFSARDESGNPVNGTLSAVDIAEATRLLRADGKYPISIRPAGSQSAADTRRSGGIRIRRRELIQFSTQLSIMLETGVTLTDALDCIARQARLPRYKALAEDLSLQVRGGVDFSAAISKHPRTFPRLYISLVRAAERSGMMSKMLLRATSYLRDEEDTIRRVKGALTYPAIMLGFALLTTGFLLAFVLPRFSAIYANKGAALPVPTRLLMAASDLLVMHWLPLLLGSGLLVGVGVFYFRSPGGRRLWHAVQLKLPLLGEMYRTLHLARGLRMMGTLGASGVHLLHCVENAIEATTNTEFQELWRHVSQRIRQGKPMSEQLGQSQLVPPDVAQMLHSGETSGKLAAVMEQVASYSESELKERIAELTRYIEPAMIVIMGLIIGGVALALMLPVFTIGKVVAS
ncbi:MAG: type II secretion system F family protein [Phycisphaerae bacterium]|nr:type II secretion system F family protein [Phycisphaerae bacterium]MDW8260932.1 type II secretion system F family protein [Phycisphaerales bacterium]